MEIQLGHFPQVLLLTLARVSSILIALPFYGGKKVPIKVAVSLSLVITLALLPVLPPGWVSSARELRTTHQMLFAMLSEVVLGAGVGLACHLFLSACSFGGILMDRAVGLMMARAMDPTSGASSTLIAQLLNMTFILFILLCNGHLVIIRLLAKSFSSVPHSTILLNRDFIGSVLSTGEVMYNWGLRLAIPLLCASLLVNACLGLIARLAPDFNILFLSLPVRLIVGLSVFGLTIKYSASLFERIIEQMIGHCALLLTP